MSLTVNSSYVPAQTSSQGVFNKVATKNAQTQTGAELLAAGSQDDAGEDQLELTSDNIRKQLARGPLASLFGVEPDSNGCIQIPDIRAAYAGAMERFASKLNDLLNEEGVDRRSDAVLRTDGMGMVRVTNDHPDREKIEAIFQDNPDLANEFRGLSATADFLRAADESSKFQAAYAKDPQAAVARYSYLFDNSPAKAFTLHINQDAITEVFEFA